MKKLVNNYTWNKFMKKQDFSKIEEILEKSNETIYPPKELIFSAFYVDPSDIRVVFIGQDPYIKPNQANGYSFSVPKGVNTPPSLMNIYNNMYKFKHISTIPTTGDISILKYQGCFFLNTTLTVFENKSNSHEKYWSKFSNNLIEYLNKLQPMIFVLWGNNAISLKDNIDTNKHKIIGSSHPSPLGFKKKLANYPSFFEQDHFGLINQYLEELEYDTIYWNIITHVK